MTRGVACNGVSARARPGQGRGPLWGMPLHDEAVGEGVAVVDNLRQRSRPLSGLSLLSGAEQIFDILEAHRLHVGLGAERQVRERRLATL